jgi:HK97 gp10 family phage protein
MARRPTSGLVRGKGRMSLEVEGVRELQESLRKMPEALRRGALKEGVGDAGAILLREATLRVPIATGALLGTLVAEPVRARRPGRIGVTVGTTAEGFYGFFLEYGTSRMAARPWLRPALVAGGPAAIAAAQEAVERTLARSGPVPGTQPGASPGPDA